MICNISKIQRFSTEDGPGIRTTVFMQGCNLFCPWCHNPETQTGISLLFYKQRCISCGICASVCNYGCHILTNGIHELDRSRCSVCDKCADECPSGALQISGKRMSVGEVFETIMKDLEFYRNSGGGVTLSGGEPMLQPEACAELSRMCAENAVPVIIDTAASVPPESFEACIPFVSRFFVDIKLPSEKDYSEICGGDLKLIAGNIKMLAGRGCHVEIRVPVIPGFNCTAECLDEIRKIGAENGAEKITYLPFHQLGESKYEALGKSYALKGQKALTQEEVEDITGVII